MKSRIAPTTVLALAAAATAFFWFGRRERGGRKGTIVLYRDEDDVCQTFTTPFLKAFKDNGNGKVRWKIDDDEFECLGTNDFVKIVFDNPDILRDCVKKGKDKIECELAHAPVGTYKYSVYIGDRRTEDPELQIEM